MTNNPFFYGNPVSTANFLNRRHELRRVAGRLLSGGQSSGIVGDPRMGKTSLLHYLAAPEIRSLLYRRAGERMLFSYLDTHMIGGEFTPAQFWERALVPLKEQLVNPSPNSSLAKQYRLCCKKQFGTFSLEILFRLLRQARWQLVLLLDEFDVLLYHPVLNSAEFFGGLRALVTRSGGALAIVIASGLSLSTLNEQTQHLFKYTGSPYFNFLAEIRLGPFPERDVATLLSRAGARFKREDRRAICAVAGRQPYLLQAAASAMWDAWEQKLKEGSQRRRYMAQRLYREHLSFFKDTWRIWTPVTRKLMTIVALAHIDYQLPGRTFLPDPFISGLINYAPELHDLQDIELVEPCEQTIGGWRITPRIIVWWLADEMIRAVREQETSFEEWLKAQQLEYLLTLQEREQLRQVTQNAAQLLQHRASTLIESFAKGLVGE